jgi:virginiamycin B lyase
MRLGRVFVCASMLLATAGPVLAAPMRTASAAPTGNSRGSVAAFALPRDDHGWMSITAGPDGNLWTTNGVDAIVKMTPHGRVTLFHTGANGAPLELVAGPDGNLWFTNFQSIGRITPDGRIDTFPTPTPRAGIRGLVVGADGNLWFAESAVGKIGRARPSGSIDEFPLPGALSPTELTTGTDGNVWFLAPDVVGRVTPSGTVSTVAIPEPHGSPRSLVAGPEGTLWFGDYGRSALGRVAPDGTVTELAVPGARTNPVPFSGPDGRIWFSVEGTSLLGASTTEGKITMFPITAPEHQISGAVAGTDGNTWLTEYGTRKVTRVTPSGGITTYPLPSAGMHPTSYVTLGPDNRVWFLMSRRIVRNGAIVGYQDALGQIKNSGKA